ncbi:MAG: metal-dependent transcriptional regulator [Planctomycetota bacterium]|nr:MAG: metal-dependent transcriptional regulator [Planctomycetota bacterium]
MSQAKEDYIKTIYKLQKEEDKVSTQKLAQMLGVSSPSVTKMIKKLKEEEWVDYTSYQGVALTEKGRAKALEMIRRHRLIELYLHEKLGYTWDEVHEEAEALEHHVSPRFIERIERILNYPKFDPHGDPIPCKKGNLPTSSTITLLDIQPPKEVIVTRVNDGNPKFLQYLASMDLHIHTLVKVVKKAPFHGPMTLKIGDRLEMIGEEVCRQIYVKEKEENV